MSVLRQIRALVLGETWAVPLGVAGVLAVAAALDGLDAAWWPRAGAAVLAAGVLGVYLGATRVR